MRWCGAEGIPYQGATAEQVSTFLITSPRSLQNMRLYALRAFYAWQGGFDPTVTLRVRALRQEPKPPFEDRDLDALVTACHTAQERALILALLHTGARIAEVAAMRTQDFLLDGTVQIKGKGEKTRRVYVHPRAADALKRYLQRREGPIWISSNPYAPLRFRGKVLTVGGLRSIVYRVGERAGVEKTHPHRFRTTFAHHYLEAGGDVGALQYLMGHSNVKQTLFYAQYGAANRALAQQRRMALVG